VGGKNEPSHYWVTVSDTIVDMGPHYLTKGSSFPAAQIPFVVWADASALPKFLRYKPQIEYDPSVQLRSTKEIVDRVADFVEQCRARYKIQVGQPKLPGWIATDTKSVELAAAAGDFWARNALRFANMTSVDRLPF
jgi:hypothetical protein